MIPMVVSVDIRHEGEGPRRIRLWLPLFLLWLLLTPLAILLSPIWVLALLLFGPRAFTTPMVLFDVLTSLSGTLVEVSAADALVFIRIR